MADLSQLKSNKSKKAKNRFGTPPNPEEKSNTLSAPETAPISDEINSERKYRKTTGRTVTFGTRVSPEFLKDFKRTAFENEMKLVDLLEASLEAFKDKNAQKNKR